ncbi:hypothetical protein IE81DRAFT_349722 [Ceraceosorus guamensis]|uniref:Uncharacterized protein n=1 Tax=Ceraceosorus guamensis TaxID=1522189 RepID=A0A316VU42_9BASI|nr:hypothetical protein IE81DRAFT_349722 [Ceraceosorus guamensis]PWN39943.1 hypothetical protein IE81DRAFT_349722 [Ceraceosorus guamensis]
MPDESNSEQEDAPSLVKLARKKSTCAQEEMLPRCASDKMRSPSVSEEMLPACVLLTTLAPSDTKEDRTSTPVKLAGSPTFKKVVPVLRTARASPAKDLPQELGVLGGILDKAAHSCSTADARVPAPVKVAGSTTNLMVASPVACQAPLANTCGSNWLALPGLGLQAATTVGLPICLTPARK